MSLLELQVNPARPARKRIRVEMNLSFPPHLVLFRLKVAQFSGKEGLSTATGDKGFSLSWQPILLCLSDLVMARETRRLVEVG